MPEPDRGPVLASGSRGVAVHADHPLARRATVDLEDPVPYELLRFPVTLERRLRHAWKPTHAPSGRPLHWCRWSDRYVQAITDAATREFGAVTTRGAQAHLDLDDSHGHDDMMFETTAKAVELYGTAEEAYEDLRIFIDLGEEFYVQLYDATVGAPAAV